MATTDTPPDILARIAKHDLDDMVEKIVRAWDASRTPSDLRTRFATFAREHAAHVDRLSATLLAAMAWWITKGREAGHDPDVLDQVALQTGQHAIAVISRAMKQRQGQPFDPARVAIVAYAVAEGIAKSQDFKADLEAVTQTVEEHDRSFSGEVVRLRALIEAIAEEKIVAGDVAARCRAEQKRWEDAA